MNRALAAAVLVLTSHVQSQASDGALDLALLPSLNVKALVKVYQPLRDYLQDTLSGEVRLITARDYRTYIDRTQRRTYRVLITAPHFARLAQLEAGYIPLLRVKRELAALLVTTRSGGLRALSGLRGGRLATPDPLAIVSMLGLRMLRGVGIDPDIDVTTVAYRSFATALYATINEETDATLTAHTALGQMPLEVKDAMVSLARSRSVPPVMLIARDDVSEQEQARLKSLLLAFENDPRSEIFWETTKFQGYRELGDGDMESLDPFVQQLKVMLHDR